MDEIRIIEVKQGVFEDNNKDAEDLRRKLKQEQTFLLNLMSSPGSGKTSTLLALAKEFEGIINWAVMEADIDSAVDAETMQKAGVRSIQIHTGGMCHLDAQMTAQGIEELGISDTDLVILENVGNLVCPAEFDTGAALNLVILSVPEGDDKPLKYPLMFQKADVVLVNKIDAMPVFDFDLKKVEDNIHLRNKDVKVFPVSAKTGEGFDAFCKWLSERI